MLALTRKKGEAIIIDGGIEVCIIDIQGDKVKLGITAPKSTNILRQEVYDAIKGSNQAAICCNQGELSQLKGLLMGKEEEK